MCYITKTYAVLSTQCIYSLRMAVSMNSRYFHIQPSPIFLSDENRYVLCEVQTKSSCIIYIICNLWSVNICWNWISFIESVPDTSQGRMATFPQEDFHSFDSRIDHLKEIAKVLHKEQWGRISPVLTHGIIHLNMFVISQAETWKNAG